MRPFVVLIIFLLLTPLLPGSEVVIKKHKDGSITVTHQRKAYIAFCYRESEKDLIEDGDDSQYVRMIKSYARQYEFSENIALAVAKVESDFNPAAVSHKGAIGIMQLMKDTARQYGVTNRYNARENIKAGIKHLKYLYGKYNRNLPLTLAAYNAGESAVKKYGGVPPYTETRNYIKKVRAFMGADFSTMGGSTKIYQYQTKDGRLLITDQYQPDMNQKKQ